MNILIAVGIFGGVVVLVVVVVVAAAWRRDRASRVRDAMFPVRRIRR